MTQPATARLFTNGRSQAVRLPKAYRFDDVTEVTLERMGDGVLLRPVRRASIQSLIDSLSVFESFPDRQQPGIGDSRETL